MAKKKSSSSKAVKKATKTLTKTAKKNPVAVIIIIVVALCLVGAGVAGYFIWKSMNPDMSFELIGQEKTYVSIGGTYVEEGAIAKYGGKDVSSEIKITYYDKDKQEVSAINTENEAEFTAKYAINYQKLNKELTRRIIVSDVSEMSINFLELGNKYTGDSTYIKAGDVDILIDAGSRNNSAGAIASFVDNYCTDGKLEYVIATHAHQDHIAGFVGTSSIPGIFKKYQVETIIDFALTNADSKVYKDYVSERDAEVAAGAKHYTALDCTQEKDGAQKVYDIAPGITMEVLYQKFYEQKTADENDYSVCVLFTQGDNHYLFTGDLEKDGEESLVTNNNLPEVELFKGGHHGSYTANTDNLLSVIKPKVVCICCCAGSDEYTKDPASLHNFPAQEAVDRIGKYTAQVFVTSVVSDNSDGYESMNGNITFYSEKGKAYTVTGSNNNTILKDTTWFKSNRTWPSV